MHSSEFARRQQLEQRGMVERGEVMPALMIEPPENADASMCFWCGDITDTLLFGPARLEGKKAFTRRQLAPAALWEAPPTHEPCKTCLELRSRGTCFLEAAGPEGEGRPTGRWWILTEKAVRTLIRLDATAEKILTARTAFIRPDEARRVGLYDVEART